jgi:catechol 2,3-dioxygenase-like lactoylglutathione lyase family enzyme
MSFPPVAAGAPFAAMNTVLYCRRFAQTVDFYERVLALPRGYANEWFVEFRVAPGACLSVAHEDRTSVETAHGAGITLTLRADDIRACHAALSARGAAPPPVGPRPFGAEGFVIRDPEGTRVEFWAPVAGGDRPRQTPAR